MLLSGFIRDAQSTQYAHQPPVFLWNFLFSSALFVHSCSPAEGFLRSAGSKFVTLMLTRALWAQNCCWYSFTVLSAKVHSVLPSVADQQSFLIYVSALPCFSEFHLNREFHSLSGFSCKVQCREQLQLLSLKNSFRMKLKQYLWRLWRWCSLKIILFLCLWKLDSVCFLGGLNVIKLRANLPKHYSWKTAEGNCSLDTNFRVRCVLEEKKERKTSFCIHFKTQVTNTIWSWPTTWMCQCSICLSCHQNLLVLPEPGFNCKFCLIGTAWI